jgi:hypothetical protein
MNVILLSTAGVVVVMFMMRWRGWGLGVVMMTAVG